MNEWKNERINYKGLRGKCFLLDQLKVIALPNGFQMKLESKRLNKCKRYWINEVSIFSLQFFTCLLVIFAAEVTTGVFAFIGKGVVSKNFSQFLCTTVRVFLLWQKTGGYWHSQRHYRTKGPPQTSSTQSWLTQRRCTGRDWASACARVHVCTSFSLAL